MVETLFGITPGMALETGFAGIDIPPDIIMFIVCIPFVVFMAVNAAE